MRNVFVFKYGDTVWTFFTVSQNPEKPQTQKKTKKIPEKNQKTTTKKTKKKPKKDTCQQKIFNCINHTILIQP